VHLSVRGGHRRTGLRISTAGENVLDSVAPSSSADVVLDVSAALGTGEGPYSFTVAASSPTGVSLVTSGDRAPALELDYRRAGPMGPVRARPAQPAARPAVVLPAGPDSRGCMASALLVPSCGAWLGVAPGSFTTQPKPAALADFETAVGATVDVVHLYHRAGQLFPTPDEIAMAREPSRPRLLFLNYKPEGGHSWAQVADGWMDPELDRLAEYIRTRYADPFFLAVHHEPEDEVRPEPGSGFTAADYAAMFRHVVERLRADGVTNAVTVFDVMGSSKYGVRSWFDRLYPGDDVVDWIGWDPYACVRADRPCEDYAGLLDQSDDPRWPGFLQHVRRTHPSKPLMLAEWGVTGNGPAARKAAVFDAVREGLADHPEIKALVYFDAKHSPLGDTRVDSSGAALRAFRRLAANPWFAQRPPS
jgi:hypothetical protein